MQLEQGHVGPGGAPVGEPTVSASSSRPAMPSGLGDCPVVAILRRLGTEAVLGVAAALAGAGVRVLEVTIDSPEALETIRRLKASGLELEVGAGTVLSIEAARGALDAGATFLVSPHVDLEIVRFAARAGVAALPGAATASEIVAAWSGGAAAVKLFPAAPLGLETLVALRDPLPHVPLVAVGGVTGENAVSFLEAGAVAVGVGSWLSASGDAVEAGRRAEQLVARLSGR